MNEKINCIETNLPARSFAVIGHPIGHTMSPFIHNKLFALSNGCGAVSYHALDISPGGTRIFHAPPSGVFRV